MNVKILLVEDSHDDIFLAKRALSKLQLDDVDIVHNGREALQYLFGDEIFNSVSAIINKPDLILLDQRMPILDGLQFMEFAHRALHTYNISVIVITSSTLEIEKERFFELGVKDYIGKPINIEGLRRAINSVLN
ncbi:MAG: response regulator [Desulfuromonadaceae bacterium]|nr:response regulator [Desulfuromonadaceae bacterium]